VAISVCSIDIYATMMELFVEDNCCV